MPLGIESIKDIVELIALVVGILAILWGILTYTVSRNQFSFSVMISCIERFQAILPKMSTADKDERLFAIKQYVDLCNEELFYFKNNYIPDEVVDEWIEGMLAYLPLIDDKGNNLNTQAAPEIISHNLLQSYPRIQRAFKVGRPYDIKLFHERMKLVELIKENYKQNYYKVD